MWSSRTKGSMGWVGPERTRQEQDPCWPWWGIWTLFWGWWSRKGTRAWTGTGVPLGCLRMLEYPPSPSPIWGLSEKCLKHGNFHIRSRMWPGHPSLLRLHEPQRHRERSRGRRTDRQQWGFPQLPSHTKDTPDQRQGHQCGDRKWHCREAKAVSFLEVPATYQTSYWTCLNLSFHFCKMGIRTGITSGDF